MSSLMQVAKDCFMPACLVLTSAVAARQGVSSGDTVGFINDHPVQPTCCVQLNRVVISDAHCVTTWGYSLRPAYLGMSAIKQR